MLQQTQVKQGWPYYEKFLKHYPTVFDLANAPEEKVMLDWAGLGYYNRARNLHFTAKDVSQRLGGKFPEDFDGLVALKGIGAYTAAAIASFAYNKAHAVVDGNVMRVLSRVFAIEEPIDTTAGKKTVNALAQKLIDRNEPGLYNQAIMDFGATVCTPQNPKCPTCPMRKHCLAFKQKRVGEFPVVAKRIALKERHLHYFVVEHNGHLIMKRRDGNDIWKGLYDFPWVETTVTATFSNLLKKKRVREWIGNQTITKIKSESSKHNLSHQKLFISFYSLHVSTQAFKKLSKSHQPVPIASIAELALPKPIDNYLKKRYIYDQSIPARAAVEPQKQKIKPFR